MSVLTIILFLSGIACLFWGWRSENPPSEEIMTALKGVAHLKREVARLDQDVASLETQVAEQRLSEVAASFEIEGINMLSKEYIAQKIPSKYQGVLDLAATGMSIIEIATTLSLSQDAVSMVLQTYGRGEQ